MVWGVTDADVEVREVRLHKVTDNDVKLSLLGPARTGNARQLSPRPPL